MLRVNGLNEQQRDRLIQEIFERDVAVNVHFVPLPMMTYYRNLGYDISDYPQAYCNYAAEVSLPVYYDLNPGMQREVITAVKAAMEKVESAL